MALLASASIAVCLVSLAGHLTGQTALFTPMASHTAAGVALLGAGILAFVWRGSHDDEAGWPSWLFVVITMVGVVASVSLWQALSFSELTYVEGTVAAQLGQVQSEIHAAVTSRVTPLSYAAHLWEPWALPQKHERTSTVRRLPLYVPGYRSVGWVDPEFHLRWLALEDNQPLHDADLSRDARRRTAMESARTRRLPALTRPVQLPSGVWEFNVYVPVYRGPTLEGFLFGAFRFQDLFADVLRPTLAPEYGIAILDGDEEIYTRSRRHLSYVPESAQESTAELYGVRWTVRIWPSREALAHLQSKVPETILAAGLLVALLLGAAVYLAQTARLRTRLAERMSRELERRAGELARSNTDLRQFAYVASHDLQQPLRTVASFTQLLAARYRGRLDTDADEIIGFAVDGARRMQTLVNDLLAYWRVEARGVKRARVDCEIVLENTLAGLKTVMEETSAQVTHDPLPVVHADETQLGQIFLHLIGNALKFHGPEPPRIHVSAQPVEDAWRFSVRDNGIGIEPQFAEQIFAIFQRLHTESAYPGTGIGLAIAKKIVECHGGRIWVESELEKGSTFYFTIGPAEPAQHCADLV